MNSKTSWFLTFLLFIVASTATAGSLFFSEVMEFPPCVLCWYQRIAMYPLVFIYGIAALYELTDFLKYSFPLIVSGWLIALWHNLLHFNIIPENASPCREGVPCSTVYIEWFGFITIPLLSFIAFSILFILSYITYKNLQRDSK